MRKPQVAILGATSHIAKGIINNFFRNGEFRLHLYVRSQERILSFLSSIGKAPDNDCVIHEGYDDFMKTSIDAVINCVGTGTMNKLRGNFSEYFTLTEEFDNLSIGYLRNKRPDALYISFSSGAVYGRDFSAAVEEDAVNSISVNHAAKEDYYGIARLYSEAKHRAFSDLRIIDLRLFSYFSRFIDLTDGNFIAEVLDCIVNRKMLVTNNVNIVRDYVHPGDLFSIIVKCLNAGKINAAFDVMSVRPVEKTEILNYFASEYGLKYGTDESLSYNSATGSKNIYCSKYDKIFEIGYKPRFSSMDAIKQESMHILNHRL